MTFVLLLIFCMPLVIYVEEFREDWKQWRQYRKDLKQAITAEDKEHVKVLYWLNSGKF